jgi:hypothetical protein
VDVLVSGSDRPPRRLPRLPARPVALAAVAVLLAGLVAVVPVARAVDRAATLDDVAVALEVESRRAGDGSAYGLVRVRLADPRSAGLELRGASLTVPGVKVGRTRMLLPLTGDEVELPLRFGVPECELLRLPGRLVLRAAREGQPERVLEREVGRDAGPTSGVPLLQACGRVARSG